MATQTETVMSTNASGLLSLKGDHGFYTLIGYTRPPVDGSEPRMDDLASDNPAYREIRRAKVIDVRGIEDQFTLEKNGFQFYKLPKIAGDNQVDFTNEGDPKIMSIYYAAMSQWFADV